MLEIYNWDNIKRHNLRLTIISFQLSESRLTCDSNRNKKPATDNYSIIGDRAFVKKNSSNYSIFIVQNVELADNIRNVKNL